MDTIKIAKTTVIASFVTLIVAILSFFTYGIYLTYSTNVIIGLMATFFPPLATLSGVVMFILDYNIPLEVAKILGL